MSDKINLNLITGREIATIKRDLTETEIEGLGEKLATLVEEINTDADNWKAESKAYNDAKKQKNAELKSLARQRKEGVLEGDFEVGLMLDADGNTMLRIDLETGEVIGTRRATMSEKQMRIDFEEGGATVKVMNG